MKKEHRKPDLPFALLHNFIIFSMLKANPEFSPENFEVPDIDVKVSMLPVGDDKKKWHLYLSLDVREGADPKTYPYFFNMIMFGIFYAPVYPAIESEETRKEFHKILYVNGSSILYSAAREHIRTFTATGPYRPFILPTTQFLPEDAEAALQKTD
ncbi:protein-export chaperone SecB [Acetomicrobium sp. S15 = DSM 107314]|uniref:protein-export chaperone SecB n=1 Tax=Acetomicrobium sp. S15 = DSM 107314 TaxID=2529858 RepID=UPI0018E15594|nr:protein-export chaperone SecB [Acetomicrobium sp. S15 = DSM 107314]